MFFNYWEFLSGVLISIGGVSAIVFGLSTFLGKVWAERILEREKHQLQLEYENVKQQYTRELEQYKTDLDRIKAYFPKYSETQLKLYQEIWLHLINLKYAADKLWVGFFYSDIQQFVEQLENTKKKIEENALIIEKDHYSEMLGLFESFQKFVDNKGRILSYSSIIESTGTTDPAKLRKRRITSWMIDSLKNQNAIVRKQYEEFIYKICDDFRAQIKGSL